MWFEKERRVPGESRMSANNQLIIIKKKEEFEIHENCCVDNDFESNNETLLTKESCLEDAIKFANEYCNEEIVEYGTYVHPSCYANCTKDEEVKG